MNERLILETLSSLLADNEKLFEITAGFSLLLGNRMPGLADSERATLASGSRMISELVQQRAALRHELQAAIGQQSGQ
jgi:hypothetical protein